MNGYVRGVVLLLVFFFPLTMRAQSGGYQFKVNGDSLTSNVPMNEVSPRAFRHFEAQFGAVATSNWFKNGDAYVVRFSTADSSQYFVYISKRGILYKTVIQFAVSCVPQDVKLAMAAYARDCNILFAGELIEGTKPLYEVGLADASKVRIVDMRDGDIKTICEYACDPQQK